jgi:hypothetical protein
VPHFAGYPEVPAMVFDDLWRDSQPQTKKGGEDYQENNPFFLKNI